MQRRYHPFRIVRLEERRWSCVSDHHHACCACSSDHPRCGKGKQGCLAMFEIGRPMVLVQESGLAIARWCARHGCRLRIADTARRRRTCALQAEGIDAEFVSGRSRLRCSTAVSASSGWLARFARTGTRGAGRAANEQGVAVGRAGILRALRALGRAATRACRQRPDLRRDDHARAEPRRCGGDEVRPAAGAADAPRTVIRPERTGAGRRLRPRRAITVSRGWSKRSIATPG